MMTQIACPQKKRRCIRPFRGHSGPKPHHGTTGNLANKTFRERVPVDRLRCIHGNYDHLRTLHARESGKMCPKQKTMDEGQEYNVQHQLESMLLNCEEQPDGTCLYPVTYCESRLRSDHNIPGGRLYAKNGVGLQRIPKWIRHTLCHDLYLDVDIVNAHPTLLLQVLAKLDPDMFFGTLHRVVYSREELFNEGKQHGFARDEVKLFIIQLMFGGQKLPKKAWESMPWLRDLQREFIQAADILSDLPEYESLLQVMRDTEGRPGDLDVHPVSSRPKFRLLSNVMQEIENEILHSCMEFLSDQGMSIEEVVLCFDGFMVPRQQTGDIGQRWLEELSVWVEKHTTWRVSFSVKPMEKRVDLSQLQTTCVLHSIDSDVHACQIIREATGGEIAYRAEEQTYSKCPKTGKWRTGKEYFKSIIQHYCRTLDLRLNGKRKYSHNATGMRNIVNVYEAKEDPNFPARLEQGSRQRVFWSNGVYDFRTGMFRPAGPEDMTTVSVPRKYPEQAPPQEELDRVEKMLFFDTLGEVKGRALLEVLARAVAGHTEDKRWIVILGDRNSGKGVIEKALRVALGPEYVSTYNIKAFQETAHAGDAELGLKWLHGLRWSRLSFSNESIGRGRKLDANLIKQIVSGGDPIRLRLLHKMPFSVTPQCTFFNNANQFSEVSVKDALETCVLFRCKTKYVDRRKFESMAAEDRPSSWRVGDPLLKQRLETDQFADIMWHLLLRHYSRELPELPKSIQDDIEDLQQEDGMDIDFAINTLFEVTGEESDITPSSALESAWTSYGLPKPTLVAMRTKLRAFHDPSKGKVVDTLHKYINKKRCRCWKGVKLRDLTQ